MKNLNAKQLRQLWLDFYKSKNHALINSASVIPENDPTVLFTTAGMQPLVPYLMGQKHPAGTRLANIQKCIRTGDIDAVGDTSHCTFFEMLGNWSLGDYFKKEQIEYSWEFLTSEKYLGIDPKNIAVSVFEGDNDAPRDEESAKIWGCVGMAKERIFYLPKAHNWWGPAGKTGPCGPDTEMFIVKNIPDCNPKCSPACDCGKYLEIWNNVFMQYFKASDGTFSALAQKNVDTGMGLERTLCILQQKNSVYDTDIFLPIINKIELLSGKKYQPNICPDTNAQTADEQNSRFMRIVADHTRAAVHMIGDHNGITPSNVDQGYVLRRLLRRAIRFIKKLEINESGLIEIAKAAIEIYKDCYDEINQNQDKILDQIKKEQDKFEKTIQQGLKEFDKLKMYLVGDTISGKTAFKLYDTYGFPIEMTAEIAKENNLKVDTDGFEKAFSEHQEKSKDGAAAKFAGGLSDDSEAVTSLHTATHLLHAALKVVLGEGANQKGSNITAERLRFDFSFDRPMEKGEIERVEQIVNNAIDQKIDIVCQEMELSEAKKLGAIGLFESKYAQKVKVYKIGDYSLELCGGPHVENTKVLGKFKIEKEQSSSAGVRRIKATLS
ncbi:MAG: alanine--tRNA ligase [Firmicutes bacterium]|nr:alanine--tRNA ligase [Bacillota bacterium]